MVGTTKVWVTRCSSTRVSHSPASNLGNRTIFLPWWRDMNRPSVPAMWKMGADIMSTTWGLSGSMGLE